MLTATDNVTELDISELVDMESDPGCEHSAHSSGNWGHTGPAWAVIRRKRSCGCSKPAMLLICKGAWDRAGEFGLRCFTCNTPAASREESWELVSIL